MGTERKEDGGPVDHPRWLLVASEQTNTSAISLPSQASGEGGGVLVWAAQPWLWLIGEGAGGARLG